MSANSPRSSTFSKPIVFGTISYLLGQNKKQQDKNTHRWSVYVRGPNNEDLSTFIDKVVFVLHETFPDYQRAITKPPFEVVEKGWGEFDILIQIHFKTHYPQLELAHKLKFYASKQPSSSQNSRKPVVSEFYDEIVFVNPSAEFSELLRQVKYLPESAVAVKENGANANGAESTAMQVEEEEEEQFDWKAHYLRFDAQDHRQKLEDALAVIHLENDKLRQDSVQYDTETEALNLELETLNQQYQELKAQQAVSAPAIEEEVPLVSQNSNSSKDANATNSANANHTNSNGAVTLPNTNINNTNGNQAGSSPAETVEQPQQSQPAVVESQQPVEPVLSATVPPVEEQA